MNKIEELIKELCPNGVEWKKLGDKTIFNFHYGKGNTIPNNNGKIPVYGGNGIVGYTDTFNCRNVAVIGHIGSAGSVNWAADDCYVTYNGTIADINDNSKVLSRYLYEFLLGVNLPKYVKGSQPFLSVSDFSDVPIPLPPLPIQEEIVRILDKFVEQQEQLEKLIELRKKQYEYYREELLTPKDWEEWETVKIGDLGVITRGRRFVRDDVRESGMPCIHYGDMYTCYGITAKTTKTFLDRDFPKKMQYAKKGDVVVVGAGENDLDIGVGTVWNGDEPAAVHDACYILQHKQNAKYIAYFLRTNNYHQQLRKYVSEGKICSISGAGLGSVFIPIPTLRRQQEIVDFLDKFETNIAEMKSSLYASKSRYAYYRDQLLNFKMA